MQTRERDREWWSWRQWIVKVVFHSQLFVVRFYFIYLTTSYHFLANETIVSCYFLTAVILFFSVYFAISLSLSLFACLCSTICVIVCELLIPDPFAPTCRYRSPHSHSFLTDWGLFVYAFPTFPLPNCNMCVRRLVFSLLFILYDDDDDDNNGRYVWVWAADARYGAHETNHFSFLLSHFSLSSFFLFCIDAYFFPLCCFCNRIVFRLHTLLHYRHHMHTWGYIITWNQR